MGQGRGGSQSEPIDPLTGNLQGSFWNLGNFPPSVTLVATRNAILEWR